MNVLSYQILGIAYAFAMQLCLCGLAIQMKRFPFVISYLLSFAVMSALLTCSAFFPVWPLVVVILTFGAYSSVRSFDFIKAGVGDLFRSKVAWLGLAVLLLDLFYASFPDYRYDQWNYHLLVGKYLSQVPKFQTPIMFDHIFFTGASDFWSRIARLVSSDDVWNHCASNAFSYSTFVISFVGLILKLSDHFKIDKGLVLLIGGALFFCIADHEVLVSSKPDAMLIPYGLSLLYLLFFADIADRSRWALVGVFVSVPISMKLTYLNFSIALSITILVFSILRKIKIDIVGVSVGLLGGLVLCLPFLFKNYMFFGNPIHPVQMAFFKSAFWNDFFTEYWLGVSKRARTLSEYIYILVRSPITMIKYNMWFILIAILSLVASSRKVSFRSYVNQHAFQFSLLLLMTYFLFWPLFYEEGVAARFLYGSFSLFVLLSIAGLSLVKKRGLAILFLVIPLLGNSSLDVKVNRMARAATQSSLEYYAQDRMPHKHYAPSLAINAHRREYFPDASYLEKRVLTDTAMGYFLDTERLAITSPDWTYHYHQATGKIFHDNAPVGCVLQTMRKYDIRYYLRVWYEHSQSPQFILNLIPFGEQIDNDSHVYYFSKETLNDPSGPECK